VKPRCWAAIRGDCAGGISGEHLISKCLFSQSKIFVQGFPWCAGQEREVGVASTTANILCRKHNNELSPLDDAAAHAVDLFQNLGAAKAPNKPVDARLLERWLLKTAINSSVGQSRHIGVGMADSQAGWPAPYLVDVAFGGLSFSHCMGAYVLTSERPRKRRYGEILIVPIVKDEFVGGFYFSLRGVDVFLSLSPGLELSTLRALGVSGLSESVLDAQLKQLRTTPSLLLKSERYMPNSLHG